MKTPSTLFLYGMVTVRIIELVAVTMIGLWGGYKFAEFVGTNVLYGLGMGCLFFVAGIFRFIRSVKKYMR